MKHTYTYIWTQKHSPRPRTLVLFTVMCWAVFFWLYILSTTGCMNYMNHTGVQTSHEIIVADTTVYVIGEGKYMYNFTTGKWEKWNEANCTDYIPIEYVSYVNQMRRVGVSCQEAVADALHQYTKDRIHDEGS